MEKYLYTQVCVSSSLRKLAKGGRHEIVWCFFHR